MIDQINTINECRKANEAGLENVLTVRNIIRPGKPSRPPKNIKKYKEKLDNIIENCQPSIIAIEYKETSDKNYLGTATKYRKQLKAACEVAHNRKIKCTNGGFPSDILAIAVYAEYIKNDQQDKADDFAKRAISDHKRKIITGKKTGKFLDQAIEKANDFIKIYKEVDIDFVNIHWNIEDAKALEECAKFIEDKTNEKKIISSEFRKPLGNKETQKIMERVTELEFPCVMWYFPIEGPKAWAILEQNDQPRDPFYKLRQFIYKRFIRIAKVSNKNEEARKLRKSKHLEYEQ